MLLILLDVCWWFLCLFVFVKSFTVSCWNNDCTLTIINFGQAFQPKASQKDLTKNQTLFKPSLRQSWRSLWKEQMHNHYILLFNEWKHNYMIIAEWKNLKGATLPPYGWSSSQPSTESESDLHQQPWEDGGTVKVSYVNSTDTGSNPLLLPCSCVYLFFLL